ncbi:MAG: hypothetical protein NDI73_09790 [Desulfuromonadales bacterium]|nr:hypothetical protein [Desulfuromonadales bacterium]
MKAVFTLIVTALLFVGLTGCATTSATGATKVKCPACGHEFTPPAVGP